MLFVKAILVTAIIGLAAAGEDEKMHLKFCTFKDLTRDCQERDIVLDGNCNTIGVKDWKRYGDKDSSFHVPDELVGKPGHKIRTTCRFFESDVCDHSMKRSELVSTGSTVNWAEDWLWQGYHCFGTDRGAAVKTLTPTSK